MWALKSATETTATVWYRASSNGALTLECDGRTFTGDTCDTSVDDGTGIVTAAGLTAGQSYPFVLRLAGTQVAAGTLKTIPATGEIVIGFGSCLTYTRDPASLQALLKAFPDLTAFVFQGDIGYMNEPPTTPVSVNGVSILGVEYDDPTDEATSMAQLYAHHRAHWLFPSMQRLMHTVPCYFQTDDHERPGNDWSGIAGSVGVTGANFYVDWASTQEQVDNIAAWSRAAFAAYYKGNPSNSDANAEGGVGADRQLYFRQRFGPHVEAFFLECCEFRTDITATDSESKRQLGSTQEAWLLARLAASDAPLKPIFASKAFYGLQDDWSDYATEQGRIVDAIHAASGWAQPGGHVVLTGDTHYGYVSNNAAKPLASVCACPLGAGAKTNISSTYPTNIAHKVTGIESNGIARERIPQMAGFVRVPADGAYMEVGWVTEDGAKHVLGQIRVGSNALTYPATRFG